MQVVDLTLTIYEGMPCFPVDWYPKPKFEAVLTPDTDPSGSHRHASKALLFNHGGTHLDAPWHYDYFDGKKTIDNVPVDALVGDCIWLHLPQKQNLEPITAADLEAAASGLDLAGKRLIITTGYTDANWGKDDYFQVSPYLAADAGQWMVDKKIKLVGIDFQTDKPGDAAFPVHNILLSNEIYILEYLCNIEEMFQKSFGKEFLLAVGAIKLKGLEASTARVFAISL